MVYTEVITRNGIRYFYRVISIRKGSKVVKKRIYLGRNLDGRKLKTAEKNADAELNILGSILSENDLKTLSRIKEEYRSMPAESYENRYESFCSMFTYNTNAIEGNTLTLQETAQLLFENIVPSSKSLREINETLNHKKAFDYILSYRGDISKELVLNLHKIVIKDTLKPELAHLTGCYRDVQVYIRGVEWMPPPPEEVPQEMKTLLTWYSINKKKVHPLVVAAYFHSGFEIVHPFVDGNGRVGRLLMNFILRKNGYPMINILNTRKNHYYNALQESQIKGNLKPLVRFLLEQMQDTKIRF